MTGDIGINDAKPVLDCPVNVPCTYINLRPHQVNKLVMLRQLEEAPRSNSYENCKYQNRIMECNLVGMRFGLCQHRRPLILIFLSKLLEVCGCIYRLVSGNIRIVYVEDNRPSLFNFRTVCAVSTVPSSRRSRWRGCLRC